MPGSRRKGNVMRAYGTKSHEEEEEVTLEKLDIVVKVPITCQSPKGKDN